MNCEPRADAVAGRSDVPQDQPIDNTRSVHDRSTGGLAPTNFDPVVGAKECG